jgi:hypothetical protein
LEAEFDRGPEDLGPQLVLTIHIVRLLEAGVKGFEHLGISVHRGEVKAPEALKSEVIRDITE